MLYDSLLEQWKILWRKLIQQSILNFLCKDKETKKKKEKKTILVNFSFRESLILLRYSSVYVIIYLIKSKKLSND